MLRFLVLASLVACSLGGAVFRRPRLDDRIAGGELVTIEEVPYQVSYEYEGKHICGGSIISEYWVVTAAQCTDGRAADTSSLFRAGSSQMESGGTEHYFAHIAQHPKFDTWTLDFDISVVGVSEPFTFGPKVGPIALAQTETPTGFLSTVSGWGIQAVGGSLEPELHAVQVEIMYHEDCDEAYAPFGGITENMICAGGNGGGKGACQGDTGGPLVFDGILVGIVSWGFGCVNADYPGVYTNVAKVKSFIP